MKKDIVIPAAGESVTEADIVSWYKESGDFVEMDEPLLELETDKASMDLTAEISGILEISTNDGTVKVGDIVGSILESSTPPRDTTTPDEKSIEVKESIETTSPIAPSTHYASGHPSPAAEKMIQEKNITPSDVQGTGKDGRITKQDVENTPSQKAISKEISQEEQSKTTPVDSTNRLKRTEGLSRLRKTLMKRLVDAQQTTASLTTFNEIDMSAVMDIRKKYKEDFKEKHNIGLGFMSFFTKAVTMALKNWPLINAIIEGENVIFHDYCDIGIAVSTPKGLVVPVVKNAESMTFAEIESAIRTFALKGRDGKITIDDMSGGTFTITNGGTFGSMLSTPILNRPQSAILGMHNIVQRPTAVNGEVKIRPIMYVALTYDHRLIDGAEAVQFLVNLKNLLEDPTRLLIDI